MTRVILIRHGATAGNAEGRYIGATDEPLLEAAARELSSLRPAAANVLFVSPLLRCRQTAAILYPGMEQRVRRDLRECDFGAFEGKNWRDLTDDPDYQRFIDSNGTAAFPRGENPAAFRSRSVGAFLAALDEVFAEGAQSAAFVVHGGTIMSVMERFGQPARSFYDWHVRNGGGYLLDMTRDMEGGWRTDHVEIFNGSGSDRRGA